MSLRVLVIGAGRMGRVHIDAMRGSEHVEPVAVVEPFAASREQLADSDLALYASLDAAGRLLPPLPALGLFVFGWILQGVGHAVYEKNSPAFFRNFVHLAIGQLWILAKAVGRS